MNGDYKIMYVSPYTTVEAIAYSVSYTNRLS